MRSDRRHSRIAATTLAALAVMSGCASGGADIAARPERTLPYRLISASEGRWRTAGLIAAGSPGADPEGDTVAVVSAADATPRLTAFDARTGETRWAHEWNPSGQDLGTGVGGPAVIGDVVIGLEGTEFKTTITGFDAHTGDRRWKVQVIQARAPFRCGDYVCIEEGYDANQPWRLAARDPRSGELRWSRDGWFSANPPMFGLFVELELGSPIVSVLDPANGHALWEVDLNERFGSNLNTTGGWAVSPANPHTIVVFVGNADHDLPGDLIGLDGLTGDTKWRRAGLNGCFFPYEIVLLGCGRDDGVSLIDPETGRDIWFAEEAQAGGGLGGLLGVAFDGDVLARTEAEVPIRIDRETGAVTDERTATRDPRGWVFRLRTVDVLPASDAALNSYIGPFDIVPWNHRTSAALEALDLAATDIPETVGVSTPRHRLFVDASGELVGLPTSVDEQTTGTPTTTASTNAPTTALEPELPGPTPTTSGALPDLPITIPA